MNTKKLFIIGSTIVRIVAFICITYAAIYFDKASILWWYILPTIMSPIIECDEKQEGIK